MIQLRQQALDIKFYSRVVEMVMKPEEIAKLKNKSTYDDGANEWTIPVFILKNREVALPSLSIKKQAQELMENQKNEREVVYADDDSPQANPSTINQNQYNNGGGGYMAQYEAAQRKSVNDVQQAPPPDSR